MKKKFGFVVVAAVVCLAAGNVLGAPKPVVTDNKPATVSVVHPAPDFALIGAGGKLFPLKSLRGQPVVVLVAPSPDAKTLRQEAGRIQELYLQFSARKTVFFAAFTGQTGRVESNVPYAIAQNGAAVAAAYGVTGKEFAVIVIGPDGNVDMVSEKVEGAQRILDIINNNGQAQAATRTGLGS